MEPNCAICDGPAYVQCPCEHQSLILAVEQAEERVLHPLWDEIRYWVTTQAKAEIHRDFQARSSLRRAQHSKYLYHNAGRFTNEMLDRVNSELRRGVDEDWRSAVQRYPEVLDFFYSQVGWTVRSDVPTEDPREPPRMEDFRGIPPPGERIIHPSMSSHSGTQSHASYDVPGAFRDPRSHYSGPSSAYSTSAPSSGAPPPHHGSSIPHIAVHPPHPHPHQHYSGFTYLRAPPYNTY
ncbi:hypothetical protein DFH27DRAFT_44859 [Peziza echinospora]|nr:hypothetical protein DFH27DRAFT_44859 [Peziza echinospora]